MKLCHRMLRAETLLCPPFQRSAIGERSGWCKEAVELKRHLFKGGRAPPFHLESTPYRPSASGSSRHDLLELKRVTAKGSTQGGQLGVVLSIAVHINLGIPLLDPTDWRGRPVNKLC
jgi:hypothetical protein